jgi:hypothetical protein
MIGLSPLKIYFKASSGLWELILQRCISHWALGGQLVAMVMKS